MGHLSQPIENRWTYTYRNERYLVKEFHVGIPAR
jgi:hypothetical protein